MKRLPIVSAVERMAERKGVKLLMLGKSGIGKTSRLKDLDPATTLFLDIEAGDLAVADWPGDAIRPASWPESRDFFVFLAGPDKSPYKARQVVFNTTPMGDVGTAGVTVSQVTEDNTPGRRVLDPKHPQADAEGYVTYSNVNTVEEMVNMISASRSYQNNIEVMNTTKSLLMKTLQMGQGS